jgi:hypothetical protein
MKVLKSKNWIRFVKFYTFNSIQKNSSTSTNLKIYPFKSKHKKCSKRAYLLELKAKLLLLETPKIPFFRPDKSEVTVSCSSGKPGSLLWRLDLAIASLLNLKIWNIKQNWRKCDTKDSKFSYEAQDRITIAPKRLSRTRADTRTQ